MLAESRKKYFYVSISAVCVIYFRINWPFANTFHTYVCHCCDVATLTLSAEERDLIPWATTAVCRGDAFFFTLWPHIKFPSAYIWSVNARFTVCSRIDWSPFYSLLDLNIGGLLIWFIRSGRCAMHCVFIEKRMFNFLPCDYVPYARWCALSPGHLSHLCVIKMHVFFSLQIYWRR